MEKIIEADILDLDDFFEKYEEHKENAAYNIVGSLFYRLQ